MSLLSHFSFKGNQHQAVTDSARAIAVTAAETLSGCDIAPEGDLLWAGTNLFAGNAVFAIRGWRHPETAEATLVGHFGPGFGEAVAAGPGGAIYRLSDTGGAPSAISAHTCGAPEN